MTVKEAMLKDLGSRDPDFLEVVREIRESLLALGNVSRPEHECVLMQGSGTFMIESVISSIMPRKLLVLINGAYGRRIENIARTHGIPVEVVEVPENRKITPADFSISEDISHVAVVHCETTTGILNPIKEIGEAVKAGGAVYIVDAMSSFGAIPIDVSGIDFLISSANKCIEGVPGFGFTLARRSQLEAAKGRAKTLSLDLYAQWAGLERDGQFRFTPPTHALLAFRQALRELDDEGGISGRGSRYQQNQEILSRGMKDLGFAAYLAPEDHSCIITSYRYPKDFHFEEFYGRLSELGFVIYPGKLSSEDCFRIGTIGRLGASDIEDLLSAIRTEQVFDLFERRGREAYFGESISILKHSLQAAWFAQEAGAEKHLVIAALLHDVGHLLHGLPEDIAEHHLDGKHEVIGEAWLHSRFGPEVSEPVRLHVDAKRYLCSVEPTYLAELSPSSIKSLELQGGAFSAEEAHDFERNPHFRDAVALRRWDDAAKSTDLMVPDLSSYRAMLIHASSLSASAPGGRSR
jgi:2-aminoethylphosphonate-pyruvate transaminase